MVGVFCNAIQNSLGMVINCELLFLQLLEIRICRLNAFYQFFRLVCSETTSYIRNKVETINLALASHFERHWHAVSI